ncbi:MAG TPA: glycosyltransferase family 4 protein [Allosphingosinicella sp.]|nr:glycosyltransferase family 4 protein [Allosphingosinicella sp.]
MRIAYPVLWPRLGRDASQEQSVKTAAALARQGVEVTLVLPKGRRDPGLSAEDLCSWFAVEGDFRVVQVRTPWSGPNLVSSCFWLLQLFRSRRIRSADLLYSRAPAMIGAGQICPIPFATEQYRLWPDEWPFLRRHVRRTARHRRCLGYILHSEYAAQSYRRAGVPEARLLVAHNGADPGAPPGRSVAREQLGLPPGAAIAVYAGRMNARKGLDQILALADLRPETLFLLVGSEGEGPIEAEARRRPNVRIVAWQGPERLPFYLAAADLLLIPASSEPLERFGSSVLPMKTFSYLAAARPILAPRTPDLAGLLVDGGNALLVGPGEPREAAAALDRILGDAALARRLGEGAAETASSFGWDDRAERIADFLRRRLAEAQPSE